MKKEPHVTQAHQCTLFRGVHIPQVSCPMRLPQSIIAVPIYTESARHTEYANANKTRNLLLIQFAVRLHLLVIINIVIQPIWNNSHLSRTWMSSQMVLLINITKYQGALGGSTYLAPVT